MNNRIILELILLLALIASSFVMGFYFGPSFLKTPAAPLVSVPAQKAQSVPTSVISDETSITSEEAVEITDPLPSEEMIKPVSLNVDHLFGFIKEVKPDGFILDFLTSQFPGVEEKRLQREFLVSNDSEIVIFQPYSEPSTPPDENAGPITSGGMMLDTGNGAPERFTLNSSAFLKDLKVGDYGFVAADLDLNDDTQVTVREIRIYPLKDNPYLQGSFTSYQGLPMEGSQ